MPNKDPQKRKETNRKAQQRYYQRNKAKYVAANARHRQKAVEFIRTLKLSLKCETCGRDHPAGLDFHHKDPEGKDIALGDVGGKGWSVARIKREIAKCRVLCAYCHRVLHYEENLMRGGAVVAR